MMNYYKFGGSLKFNHPSYVVRQADRDLYNFLKAREYCFVLNSRQMGKSSLRVRVSKQLRDEGIECAALDLTLIGVHAASEQWYKSLARQLLDSLELDEIDLNQCWQQSEGLTEVQRLQKIIELILQYIPNRLVIFIDEIDSLLKIPFKDDFLAFIRACYNRRVDDTIYDRLSFCLLGVAAPTDLIEDKERTPFNIGRSVDLSGITFAEGKDALLGGLADLQQPEQILQQILFWTGGQPFLIQKLCSLVADKIEENDVNIAEIVEEFIIHNWESQDRPEHLKTIRVRLLVNKQKSVRLLELYRQILQGKILANESEEQIILRLTGVAVKRNGCLQVYNPIYQRIFNEDWLQEQLNQLRPYSTELKQWLQSERNPMYLVQGQALVDTLAWSKDKSLSDIDYQFLAASQAEQDRKANQILLEANQKARQLIWRGGLILGIASLLSIFLAIATTIYSQQQLSLAREGIRLEKAGIKALTEFDSKQLDGLVSAIQAGKDLKKIISDNQSLAEYPTVSPLSALLNILSKIKEKNRLESHNKGVTSVNFSPDGKLIITGSNDGTLKLWQANGELLKTLKPSQTESSVNSVSFSPDGRFIASGNQEGLLTLWTADGKLLKNLKQEEPIYTLSFSPNSQMIVSAGRNGLIKLWTVDSILKKTLYHNSTIHALAFSPQGKIFITGDGNGVITFWSLEGQVIKKIQGHSWEGINSLAFSPDGSLLASASIDKTIKVWKSNGQLLKTLSGHQQSVHSVLFSRDGQKIISGSIDRTVKLWTIDGQLQETLPGHTGGVYSISLSPDGKTLASASEDTTVKLWQLADRETQLLMQPGEEEVIGVGFSRDGRTIVAGNINGLVNQWQLNKKQPKKWIDLKTLATTSLDFNLDSQLLASGQIDGKIIIVNSQKIIKILPGNQGEITSIKISPDGTKFISGNESGTIKLWRSDGTLLKTLAAHQGSVNSLSFSPNSQTFISGSQDRTIKFWRQDGTLIKTLTDESLGEINMVSFSPDNQTIAAVTHRDLIQLWNERRIIREINSGSADEIRIVNFSSDGKMIAVGGSSGKVELWAFQEKPTLLLTLETATNSVSSMKFSYNSKSLAVGYSNGTILIWNINLDNLLKQGCDWIKNYRTPHHLQENLCRAR
jgi:WD40 repeat protein